jgi:hypothetical protein
MTTKRTQPRPDLVGFLEKPSRKNRRQKRSWKRGKR